MPHKRTPDPEKFCHYCKKPLERKTINGRLEDRTVFLRRKYCNKACFGKAIVQEHVTAGAYHKRAVNFRKTTCEMCGARENLHAHHMDGDISNNVKLNIQTLCASCHLKHHWKIGTHAAKPRAVCRICGNPARRLVLCSMHYQRLKKYGDPCLTKKRNGSRYELVRETPSFGDPE